MRNLGWLLLLVGLLVGGCRSKSGSRTGWSSSDTSNYMSASYSGYNGSDTIAFSVARPGPIQVSYEAQVTKGGLAMRLLDPEGSTLWEVTLMQDIKSTQASVPASKAGEYKMVFEGRATAGSFKARWSPAP